VLLSRPHHKHTKIITFLSQFSAFSTRWWKSPLGEKNLRTLRLHYQYYPDRHDLPRAIQIREKCANRVIQAEVPAWVKGSFLYTLACFYAQLKQLEKAALAYRKR
jgi:hypothetical protein